MPSEIADLALNDAIRHKNALLKFVSPNDAGLTGSHQCGFYLPKSAHRVLLPNFPPKDEENFTIQVKVLWQNEYGTDSTIKWYGKKTRSEYRLTGFGRGFPWLTADNVGDLLVLVRTGDALFHAYMVSLNEDIADIQAGLGVEIINTWGLYEESDQFAEKESNCIHDKFDSYIKQLVDFPDTATISAKTLEAIVSCIKTFARKELDKKLMLLMENEYSFFQMMEKKFCLNDIMHPFQSVDEFIATASRMLNRRKSRAGRALENHVGFLFHDANIPFDTRPKVDGQPDVLIPGKAEYENPSWPEEHLFVVGMKTTCKDRWRQVTKEAGRVTKKYILTLQKGISANQITEMRDSNVTLIVPKNLHGMFPTVKGMELLSIQGFVDTVKTRLGL